VVTGICETSYRAIDPIAVIPHTWITVHDMVMHLRNLQAGPGRSTLFKYDRRISSQAFRRTLNPWTIH
jgi:hypothetical protein